MNLKFKSLGLVMVGAPLRCREETVEQSKHDTGCEIEKTKSIRLNIFYKTCQNRA